jgi:multimeric flavodoxin WrbA
MSEKPQVLIINASPRKYGSTVKLALVAAKGVEDSGGRAELVHLYDYRIEPCLGCVSDGEKYCRFPCLLSSDDFNKLGEKVLAADGLILATPVYWYAPSGLLKNFIDRLTSMENMIFHGGRSLLEGKVAGFIAVGLDSGVMMAIAYLMTVLNSMGVVIAPWSMAYSHSESVESDEKALLDAYNVGYLVVETIKALKGYGKHVGYNPRIDVRELAKVAKAAESSEERAKRIARLSELANASLLPRTPAHAIVDT